MTPPLSKQQLAEIRSVDLLALMSDRAAGQISGYLVALLAEVERLRTCATGAWRRIDDTLNYLASRDTTDWTADALGLGLDIVAHLDTAPHPDEDVPARPALPWSAFLTDVEAGCLVEELASLFLDYWRGDRAADTATLREVEQLLVKHRDGSQAAEAAGKDTRGGGQPSAGESTQPGPDLHSRVHAALSVGQGPLLPLPEHTVRLLTARVMDAITPLVAYRPVWDSALPPGGKVCSVCGEPVESEPCAEHAPGGPADDEPVPYALAEQAAVADFFQPGRTYTDNNGYRAPELVTYFRVEHITRHPEHGTLRAIGWMKSGAPDGRWHGNFRDEDQFDGWTEVREDPADRFPYLGTEAGETR